MEKQIKSTRALKKYLNKAGDLLVLNPEMSDKGIREAKESHVVMAFGRMNPPTTGHQALVNKMHEVAKEHSAKHVLVASHSQDAKKNPLSGFDKVKHLKRYFPNTNITLSNKEHPTFLQHAAKLHQEGHTHLHMIAGSDRVNEYKEKLNHYNGTGEGKLFNFKHIQVHSSGDRDPDAEGTEGMSASKMRAHASNNNFKEFKKGVPKHVSNEHAKELFHDTRKGMKLEEAVLDYAQRRTRAINLKRREPVIQRKKIIALRRFATDLALKRRARNAAIALVRTRVAGKRGANYKNLSTSDKIAVDRMIQNKKRLITNLSARMYQRVRKREAERVTRVRAGLQSRPARKILNAEFDFELFSKMFDNLSAYQLQEKEILALQFKAKKTGIDLKDITEAYLNAVNEYSGNEELTIQQYAFNRVNSFIAEQKKKDKGDIGGYTPGEHQANVSSLKQHVKKIEGKKSKVVWNPDTRRYKVVFEEEDLEETSDVQAASHLRTATKAQSQGKYRTADMHRKIAAALKRGDKTTAAGFKSQLNSLAEEFVIDRPTGLGVMYTAGDLGIKTKGGFEHHPSVVEEMKRRKKKESEHEIENETEKEDKDE